VPPGVFIPIAEQAGILPHLERWVIGEACAQMRDWVGRFHLPDYVRMSVNVSAGHLADPGFLDYTIATLETTRLEPGRLTIELTESSLVQNAVNTGRNLAGLRALGVAVALDDFGTGFSSLSHLTRFALDEIKVDRSFISHIEARDSRAKIIRSTVALGQNLGLQVTAEGVETREQLAFLRELGCHYAQGFLFSRPYAAEHLETILERNGRWRVAGSGEFEG
jgi:EAL domain-containing protein (putative c-di-GMP-specific phosphodiesterase class I)